VIIMVVVHIVGMLIVVVVCISLIVDWDDLFVIHSLSEWDGCVVVIVEIVVVWVFSVSFICKGTVINLTLIERPHDLGVSIIVVGIVVMAIIVIMMLWHVVLVVHIWVVVNWMVVVIVTFIINSVNHFVLK